MKNPILLFIVTVFYALVLAACGNKSTEATLALSGEIKIDGSSTVYPITEAVAEEYNKTNPDVKVSVGLSGTGGGFKKFGHGEIDINNASRLIKDVETQACTENNIKYVGLTVAFDGIAVLVNKENTWVDFFTVEELKKIWEPNAQEEITKWNQIRANWPAEDFHLYGPGVASGTYDYFTEVVVGKSGSSRGDYTASEDDNLLVQDIAGDKNSLGFFGLAYYEENKTQLKLVGIDNGNGVVLPTTETVKNNTYAPLSRPVFIYVSDVSSKRTEVVDFAKFYLINASKLVSDVGYIALPDEIYLAELEKFNQFIK